MRSESTVGEFERQEIGLLQNQAFIFRNYGQRTTAVLPNAHEITLVCDTDNGY